MSPTTPVKVALLQGLPWSVPYVRTRLVAPVLAPPILPGRPLLKMRIPTTTVRKLPAMAPTAMTSITTALAPVMRRKEAVNRSAILKPMWIRVVTAAVAHRPAKPPPPFVPMRIRAKLLPDRAVKNPPAAPTPPLSIPRSRPAKILITIVKRLATGQGSATSWPMGMPAPIIMNVLAVFVRTRSAVMTNAKGNASPASPLLPA